jgi:hypothetical protein
MGSFCWRSAGVFGTWQVHHGLVLGLRVGYLCEAARIQGNLEVYVVPVFFFGTIWSSRVNTGALETTCEVISWLLGDDTRVLVYV